MTPSTPSSPHSTTPDALEWSGPVLECEAVVIGAGPAGLFQVFQLGLQGIRAHLIDALPHVGGQCAELYGDKPIYDIPGITQCSGLELVERLQAQIAPFAPSLHLKQQVHSVERQADGRWLIGTQQAGQPATRLLTLTVFIAAGVGAFVPRSLKLDGIEALLGRHVHHHSELAHTAQLPQWAGQHVVVHGGDEIAVRQAIALATQAQAAPAKVSLLHRRDVFQAAPELLSQLQQLRESGRIHVVIGQISGLQKDAEGALQALDYLDTEGLAQQLPLDHLLICLGVSPKLGPIAEWGLDMERKQLAVTPEHFRTNLPGIYAVGDIITYPGKRKLILCAFHEATLAAFDAAEQLSGAPVLLQYTTTSTRLHERLGVAVPTTRPPHAS